MNNQEYGALVTTELALSLGQIKIEETAGLLKLIEEAKAVFVVGAGRSGFMARAFCMRLMHLGIKTYLVGETTTPGIKESDLLVIASGSGETKSLVSMAEKAKACGAKLGLVTIDELSSIAKMADAVVRINAPSPKANREGSIVSMQPMGNLFEQSLLLYLDILIMILMERRDEDAAMMFTNHANLE